MVKCIIKITKKKKMKVTNRKLLGVLMVSLLAIALSASFASASDTTYFQDGEEYEVRVPPDELVLVAEQKVRELFPVFFCEAETCIHPEHYLDDNGVMVSSPLCSNHSWGSWNATTGGCWRQCTNTAPNGQRCGQINPDPIAGHSNTIAVDSSITTHVLRCSRCSYIWNYENHSFGNWVQISPTQMRGTCIAGWGGCGRTITVFIA